MARRRVTATQRAEAVALAAAVGAEQAAQALGYDPRTVREWARRADVAPADMISVPDWASLATLAMSRAQRMVTEGKLSAVQLATIAGIATRNAAKVADPAPSAVEAREAFFGWLVETIDIERLDQTDEATFGALDKALGHLPPALLRLANAESGQPHRPALLAWFSGRTETPAGDVLAWAQAQVRAMIAEHGDLLAWSVAANRASN